MASDSAPSSSTSSSTSAPAPSTRPPARLPAILGRISLWCTFLAALILTAVIVSNVALLSLHAVATNLPLAVLLEVGPPVGLLLSTAATYINYYGSWRILRGHDSYDVGSDLKSHAADLPKFLQHQPATLARLPGCLPGCGTFVPALALGVSLVATGVTLAPAPFGVLGSVTLPSGQVSGPGAANSATPTIAITPSVTVAPTQTPHAPPASSIVSPLAYSGSCAQGSQGPQPQKITLDNSGGTGTLNWTVTIPDTLSTTGQPWANTTKSSGTVGPGQTDSFQLVPHGNICGAVSRSGAVFHADVALSGEVNATETITVTITGSGH